MHRLRIKRYKSAHEFLRLADIACQAVVCVIVKAVRKDYFRVTGFHELDVVAGASAGLCRSL